MSEENVKRGRIIGLRLTATEYASLTKKWEKSNCKKLSEYARKKLFDRAIISSYRNESLDDFMKEMMKLRKSLDSSCSAFFQSLMKAQHLNRKSDISTWVNLHEIEKKTMLTRIEDIKHQINKIADQWVQ